MLVSSNCFCSSDPSPVQQFRSFSQEAFRSVPVFQKCPIWDLGCPHGLEEAAFLDLLRSTFPQLAAGEPFDTFITDKSRKLQPLNVKALTPEEIYTAIKSIGNSALYIRPKVLRFGCLFHFSPFSTSSTLLHSCWFSTEPLQPEVGKHLLGRGYSWQIVKLYFTSLIIYLVSLQFNFYLPFLRKSLVPTRPWPISEQQSAHITFWLYSALIGPTLERGQERPQQSDVTVESKSQQDNLQDKDEEADSNTDSSSTRDQTSEGDEDMAPDPKLQTRKRTETDQAKQGRRRTGEAKMSCKVCGVWYQNYGCLMNHTLIHINDPQSVCGVCGEKFESVEALKEHLGSHQNIHNCSHCGKSFVSITRFNSHVAKHTGKGLFKCDICNKTFSNKSALNYHRWVHVENKPHTCDICQQTFGLQSFLKAHMKQHVRTEVYKCKICNKSLMSRRSVTRHMFTHSDERRYGCETCGKRFKLEKGLKSHEKTHMVRERPFLCHICCKTFPCKHTLMSHIQRHSSEKPYVCTVCSKGFTNQGCLTKHKKIHSSETPYECCKCGRRFKKKNQLTQHIKMHSGIKDFICGICGKASAKREHLKVHMRTHTGERPYQCSLCDKAFTQSHCLKTHMKTHQDQENGPLTPTLH
uniref:C2H2-type domain-containing protein n=1 Tax=Fundulus heteroclitus TaxID=8078 RepID=A0A3Q2PKS6_FUNHE